MTDDYYQFNEKAHTLKGENTGKVYRLGDRVEVQVAKVDLEQRKIDFALVDVLERAAASGPAQRARRAALRARPPGGPPGARRTRAGGKAARGPGGAPPGRRR